MHPVNALRVPRCVPKDVQLVAVTDQSEQVQVTVAVQIRPSTQLGGSPSQQFADRLTVRQDGHRPTIVIQQAVAVIDAKMSKDGGP